MNTDGIIIRPLRADDVSRIFKDWLLSYRSARGVKDVPNPTYFHWHHRLIESCLQDPTVAWLVAVHPEHPTFIYGWLCGQEMGDGTLVIHYIYVTQKFRRLGIGSRLCATLGLQKDIGVVVTGLTQTGAALLQARGNVPVYNPYLLHGRAPIIVPETLKRKDIQAEIERSRAASAVGYPIAQPPKERQ